MKLTQYEIDQLRKIANKKGGQIRVAYYCRKSQKDTSENSIDTQITALNGFIEDIRNDLKIPVKFDPNNDIYAEDNRSGTNAILREEFMRMIGNTTGEKNKGYYTAILVYKQDRFSRSSNDSNFYRGLLLSNDCFLLSMDVRDNGDAISQLMLNMISAFNQYYADNNAFLVVNGMTNLAKKGKCIFSLPYGLKSDENKNIYVDEEEAKVVKKIFEMASNHESIKDIYDYLKDNNIKRKDNSEFGMSTIHGMLRNEKYIGTYIWSNNDNKGKKNSKRKKVYRKDIPEVRIENCFEPIISKETFDKVQEFLDITKNSHCRSMAGDGYLLYGLVYCGDCGTKMYGSSHVGGKNHVKKRYYECPGRSKHKTDCCTKNINANYLEDLTKNLIFQIVSNIYSSKKQEIIDCCKIKIEDLKLKIEQYESEIADLNKRIDKLINLQLEEPSLSKLYNGKITEANESLIELNKALNTNKNKYNDSVQKIEDSINTKELKKEDLFKNSQLIKILINKIIDRIEITNTNITFIFKDSYNC